MDQQLPPDFQALMEDGTPVTAHNLLEYLAEYFYDIFQVPRFYIVGGFLKNTEFRQLCEQKNHKATWEYVFAERNYSKERMCFIIDLIHVLKIYHQFVKPRMPFIRHGFLWDTELILCSEDLSVYVDQENVEICMCLKKYMCYDLWRLIGKHVLEELRLNPGSDRWILHTFNTWTAEHTDEFGNCLERTILGPSKNCFINMLRNAWTKPDNGYYIACMQMDTELNRLYPNASVMWEPPRVFKEPIVATLQVTHV